MTVLQEALRIDESEVPSMNIPEYLVHVSKLNCNYKAIISAIEHSCSNVNVRFLEVRCVIEEYILSFILFFEFFVLSFIDVPFTGLRRAGRMGTHSGTSHSVTITIQWKLSEYFKHSK